ncbi:unnamed protein product [Cuscuta campestris]|uniref:Retrotransposon gag domain-containing protein n=1 Tax=Cuscuta campestris TaxID=132261 RepID=A0A484LZY5_9ASTE|nr:unnamed protein product [Cuscuta campestris]
MAEIKTGQQKRGRVWKQSQRALLIVWGEGPGDLVRPGERNHPHTMSPRTAGRPMEEKKQRAILGTRSAPMLNNPGIVWAGLKHNAKLEVPKFTGKEDPEIHVKTLHQNGRMMGLSGDEKCLLFFQTLCGRAVEWFHNLPAGEIDSFDELAESEELYKEFCRRSPQSYQEAYNTAWDYADAEVQVSSKREAEQGHSKGKISSKKEIELPGRLKTKVLEVKPVKSEKKPASEKQWAEKYCSFHKMDSHNTAECNSVKGVIKQMIEAGELDPEYLAQAKQNKNQWIRPEGQPAEQNKKKKAAGKEHLQVIYGGPEGETLLPKGRNGGESSMSERALGSAGLPHPDQRRPAWRTPLVPELPSLLQEKFVRPALSLAHPQAGLEKTVVLGGRPRSALRASPPPLRLGMGGLCILPELHHHGLQPGLLLVPRLHQPGEVL